MLALSFSNLASAGVFPTIKGQPSVGLNGHYIVGRWTPIWVSVDVDDIENLKETPVQLEVTAIDPDGNRVKYLAPELKLTRGGHRVEGLIKVGRLDGEIGISINGIAEKRYIPSENGDLRLALDPSTKLIVTVGDPQGFDFETVAPKRGEAAKSGPVVKIAGVKSDQLPTNQFAYDGITSLVLAQGPQLTLEQVNAIREWVAAGGRLVISLPQDPTAARSALFEWVPVQMNSEPAIVREFGGLEAYSGKNLRIPQTSTLSIPHITYGAGEVLAASRSIPYLVRVPYGLGSVTILTMDLTSSPLRDWKGLSPFCARLSGGNATVEITEKGTSKGSQLSSTGITDLSTQLHAIQEHFEKVRRVSPWFVMSWLLGLLFVIGPIDYLLVHRLLKRPSLTWVTFPMIAAVSVLLASSISSNANGITPRANQLNIVNIDVATGSVHGRHFVNIYSPATRQTSIKIEPESLIKQPATKPLAQTIWEGTPEAAFGGMVRKTGLERGATYEQNTSGELTQVPILQWSSKGLVCDSQSSAEGLVECNLKATATGSLSGTILHRFEKPIEDWMVVYQNRVYRSLKTRDDLKSLPLLPKQLWRLEQPGVFQRELRPYLTGILTMATPRFGSRSSETINQPTVYDSLSLDPFEFIRILTFHEEVGGERYTGLSNSLLNDQDCSHLLKLGRAILFGRLNQPIATIRQDNETLQPDRESTFVRLILPVAKSGELLKDLKRVVPD